MNMFKYGRSVIAALLLFAFAGAVATAQEDADKTREIERIVRNYILENPEIIETALIALEEQRREEAAELATKKISELSDKIYDSEHQVVLGNPDGDVTLVEFFDYNCGFCKRAFSDMVALKESYPNLRVVLKEFPILSESSMEAHRVAIAVNEVAPEKYLDFHTEMLNRPGEANLAKAMGIAAELGINEAALALASDKPSVNENIREVRDLAVALNISGTPSYVINDETVFGAVGFDALREKVEEAIKCETQTC